MMTYKPDFFLVGQLAKIAGVQQTVLKHHFTRGYIPAPIERNGKFYYDKKTAKQIVAYFKNRKKNERAIPVL